MKTTANVMRIIFAIALSGLFIFSCKKSDTTPPNNNPGNTGSTGNIDSVSNRLQFLNAQKIHGTSPKGPAGSSVKISFRDTLYLVDEVKIPIQFLQKDSTKKITGVFLQVQGLQGGPASDYYDVPNVPQMDSTSDTVAVILAGIDPDGLDLPFDFNITITPHGASDDPIVQITRPVRVVKHHNSPTAGCSIVTPGVSAWDWDLTAIGSTNGVSGDFYGPSRVFNRGGQDIRGSCCAGVSVYGICPGVDTPNASLHFHTFYRIAGDRFVFNDAGSYFRRSDEDVTTPVPDSSNFCGAITGFIRFNVNTTLYTGDYAIVPAQPIKSLPSAHDSLAVKLTQKTKDGTGGFGNGAGVIHQLDCSINALVLIQPDLEGFGQDVYRFYTLRVPGELKWFEMK